MTSPSPRGWTQVGAPRPNRPSNLLNPAYGVADNQSRAASASLDEAAWEKLFTDVTPEDLSAKGKPFPIAPYYFDDILEAYEKKVEN